MAAWHGSLPSIQCGLDGFSAPSSDSMCEGRFAMTNIMSASRPPNIPLLREPAVSWWLVEKHDKMTVSIPSWFNL